MLQWYFYVGIIAAICIAIFNAPQLIQVIKTKNTSGMSLGMLALLSFGNFCFALNGIGVLCADMPMGDKLSAGLPLFLANVIALAISCTLVALKVRSIYWAKKFETTEKQFCDNYQAYKTKIKMLKAEKQAAKKVEVPKDPTTPIAGI